MTTTRTLGRSGITVSAIGMGCWAIGGPLWGDDGQPFGWGEVDDAESIRTIHRALDLGVTLFDTASNYGAGHSERILGQSAGRAAGQRGDRQQVRQRQRGDHAGGRSAPTPARPSRCAAWTSRSAGSAPTTSTSTNCTSTHCRCPRRSIWSTPWRPWSTRARSGRTAGAPTTRPRRRRSRTRRPALRRDPARRVGAARQRGGAGGLRRTRPGQPQPWAAGDGAAHRSRPGRSGRTTCAGGPRSGWSGSPTAGRHHAGRPGSTRSARADRRRAHPGQGALGWLLARSPRTVPIPGLRTVAQADENAGALSAGPLSPAEFGQVRSILGADASMS